MSETNMPVAEAAREDVHDEHASYELAFHVLPTVAEGEVTRVFEDIKGYITKAGGSCTLSEAPERFELAYEIEKSIEGKHRSFKSAYFGWVRFTLPSTELSKVIDEVEANVEILRHIVLRLSKTEEATPFYFHEALATDTVVNVDVEEALATPENTEEEESEEVKEETDEEEDVVAEDETKS